MAKQKKVPQTSLSLFEDNEVRKQWNEEEEEWYFSVIDIVAILSESARPRKYWSDLKLKLVKEGSQLSEKIGQLKMLASDGKLYETDVLPTEAVFRLIQSIPSPKAEPFKQWLAVVGSERLREIDNPEIAVSRAVAIYKARGYSDNWISKRLQSKEVRDQLEQYWHTHGIEKTAFGILTDIIYRGWADLSTKEYKKLKRLTSQNLRDHFTGIELALNMLAEASTTEIARGENSTGIAENTQSAKKGASIARNARKELEAQTGKSAISSANHLTASPKRLRLKK